MARIEEVGISRIGMFGVNFGSATYLLRSANASFNDSVTACRYGAGTRRPQRLCS